MPSLRETKLYNAISTKSLDELVNECYNHISSGKDINIRDSDTGETYLHLLCDQTRSFLCSNGVSVIYIMACKGIDLDVQDNLGETFLHKIVRIPGAYRALVAVVRCGADMMISDNRGRTAEDILLTEKPEGWEEMLHWWNKFKPGLYNATLSDNPDKELVERLLKSWCRVSMVKQGKDYSVKTCLSQRAKNIDLLYLVEKYENSIEFALAALSGNIQILKGWRKRLEDCPTFIKTVDPNIRDYSYQKTPSSPDVPLPLLATVWMKNKVDMVKLLLEYGADPSILYSSNPSSEPVKPLFFQLVSGENKPNEEIIYHVLGKANSNAKNHNGQTVLYEAIEHRASSRLVQFLLKHGINIALRDRYGRTARDHALSLKKDKYIKLIDQHVVELVKTCDIVAVESLVLHRYNYILEVVHDKEVMSLAKSTGSDQLVQILEKQSQVRDHIHKVLKLAYKGRLAELRPLLGKKFIAAMDRCGRNVCHIAVANRRTEFVRHFCDQFPGLLNTQDNLGRTPFHYAQLFYEGDKLLDHMLQKGADTTIKDVLGRTPLDYKCSACGDRVYCELHLEVKNFPMEVYVVETNFKDSLARAIMDGDQKTVSRLVRGLKNQSTDTDYLNRYNSVLFNCVDFGEEDIAIYLLKEGMDSNVFKQYDKCDPSDPMCAMLECDHAPKSFKEVAKHRGFSQIVKYLDTIEPEKSKKGKGAIDSDCITFTQFGLI